MRRVPIDSDFGTPILVLRKSQIVLFENGTIAKFRESPLLEIGPNEDANELVKNPYQFYYNHVNEISFIKMNSSDALGNKTQMLANPKFRVLVTVIIGLIMVISYFNSINFSKLALVDTLQFEFQFAIAVIIIMLCMAFEELLYNYYTKNNSLARTLQLQLVYRNDPQMIVEDNYNNWRALFTIHNLSSRFAFLMGCVYLPEVKNFDSDIIYFMKVFIFCNSLIYICAVAFSPLMLSNYISKRWDGKAFGKVNESDFESFFTFAKKQIEQSRPDSNLVSSSTLSELISGDETHIKEFKGSIWTAYNPKTYEKIESQTKKRLDLQDAIVKSVASFLNTDGGVLLIGVKDKPQLKDEPIIGIEDDFNWVKNGEIEGYRHALIQLLNDAFGDQSTLKLYLDISYPSINDKLICRIDVNPLPRTMNGEIWVKTQTLGEEEFFYRVSDTSTHASAKSALRYIRHHFEGFSVGEESED